LIEELPFGFRYRCADKKLSVAFPNVTMAGTGEAPIKRRIFEAGVLAVWYGRFQYSHQKEFVIANGFGPTDRDHFEMGQKIVDMLVRIGAVRLHDPNFSVLDIGTAHGVVPMLLAQMGVRNVRAIEPYSIREAQRNFKETEPLTARQFMAQYPGLKFSLVLYSNFSPFLSSDDPDSEADLAAARDMFYCMSMMTADNGEGWAGFNGIDALCLSSNSSQYLHPHMAKQYASLDFADPQRFGERFSVAGQMGYYIGSNPDPKAEGLPT
jgi:hypothetical protein